MATKTSTKSLSYQTSCKQLVVSVEAYYAAHRRSLPWRDELSSERRIRCYQVLVSEVMLQQTQVSRVVEKYSLWMKQFPTIEDCASSSLAEVLKAWQGLGYNRRAKYLHEICRYIVDSGLPDSLIDLQKLPGIGINTAAAIAVYCDEIQTTFVETNIRSVVLEHVLIDEPNVDDKKILQVVNDCRPTLGVRDWHWALMDYGSYLKSQNKGHLGRVTSHRKQSTFEGSKRQLRGAIIRSLTESSHRSCNDLRQEFGDERFDEVLGELEREGLVMRMADEIHLPDAAKVQ